MHGESSQLKPRLRFCVRQSLTVFTNLQPCKSRATFRFGRCTGTTYKNDVTSLCLHDNGFQYMTSVSTILTYNITLQSDFYVALLITIINEHNC